MEKLRAIVTGATGGIGRATAEKLIEAGVEVVATGRSFEKLQSLRDRCVICPGSIVDAGFCTRIVELARAGTKSIPVLVNCAGYAKFGPVTDPVPPSEGMDGRNSSLDVLGGASFRTISVNLLGPVNLCTAMVPWMLEEGRGHIVNVLSIAATHAFPGAATYCASKAGLHMFGKALAAEYRDRGIRVTSLLPGSTDTALWDSQSFQPNRADMLSPVVVAECIRDVILSPPDRSYDEIVLMPPKGIL